MSQRKSLRGRIRGGELERYPEVPFGQGVSVPDAIGIPVQQQPQSHPQLPAFMTKMGKSLGFGDVDMSSLGGVFYILVMGCILLAVGVFWIMFLVSLYAIFTRWMNEWDQRSKLKQTPLLIQDTTDWKNMEYIFNDQNRDPYQVYFQQNLLTNIFKLLSLAIFLLLFQGAIYLGMAIWAQLRDETFNQKYKHNMVALGIGIIILIIAFILRTVYNNSFLGDAQLQLRNMSGDLVNIKEKLYDSMSMDASFLQALTQGSTYTLSNMITSSASSFTQSKTPETHSLVKMAFTYNLYKFYYNAIPNHNRAVRTLREVFTPQGVKQRITLLPLMFIYQTPPLITNAFLLDFKSTLEGALGAQGLQQFTVALQERMTNVERELRTLPDMEKAKKVVGSFVNKYFATMFVYILSVFGLFILSRYIGKWIKKDV